MTALVALSALMIAPRAHAGLVATPLIYDLLPNQPPRGDVELLNAGAERMFISIEPARIDDPGLATEKRVQDPDPAVLGMIVTPSQLILEPNQRKFIRLAMLAPPSDKDRIFRVTIKPVVGDVTAAATGLKVLVGYDMLVIQRPQNPHGEISAVRQGDKVILTNNGNTNVELFQGKQCKSAATDCVELPSDRLYPGGATTLSVTPGSTVKYTTKTADKVGLFSF